ncbi:hypothetical protein ACFSQ3_11800 [Sphingobacterium corticis]|uniref:BadF-type ATPase n=1 Tax=Sphingobacterium corticis TaxID=1812823 RepID=A0ABW5NLY0_9SPHI
MIVVVYSGSRYADWRLAEKGRVLYGFKTTGINPYVMDERAIYQIFNRNTHLINNAEKIRRIYFFGAGASSEDRQEKVHRVFQEFFKNAKVKVHHDILASAIATFGNEKGIVGIIGSGSNAAYYNGKKIVPNNYGLGYIMADEGSSNWLARQLLRDLLSDLMPQGFREKFLQSHPVDRKIIMEKIYNQPNPNIFLNSFSDFILENKEDPYMSGIIKRGLEKYIKTYVLPLSEAYPDSVVNFTGSVASKYAPWLIELAEEYHMPIGTIIHEPVQNLIKYYTSKN